MAKRRSNKTAATLAASARAQLEPVLAGLGHRRRVRLQVAGVDVAIPVEAFARWLEILAHLADGSEVAVMPRHAELTTQQAADRLGVSRPHLVRLLDRGDIPHRKVGTHRRVKAADLLAYTRAREQQLRAALADFEALVDAHGLR